jgi:hypothetical protein
MEGGSVDHVARVLGGESLYIAPQMAFIPFEYPPLYFYVSALVAKMVGLGYAPLRFVSLASSLVCFGCIYRLVKVETGRAFPAFIAAGLFAATFRAGGAWLDLARVDALFLALFLLAILVLRRSVSVRGHVLAGLLFSLSFLTKQPALPMALPLVAYALFASPRRGVWLAAALIALSGLSTLVLHLATDGWYTFYVWWFPFVHAFARPVWTTFWTRDLLGTLPIAFTAALWMTVWQLLGRRTGDLFWPAACIGMVGGAYRSRLQTGGYDNVLLPAYAITAILSGLALGLVTEELQAWTTARRRIVEATVYAACLIQLGLLGYDPRAQIPSAADRRAGEHLVSLLASIPGSALIPYHGHLASAAGKPAHAHLMQVFDILKLGDDRGARLAQEFRSAIRQKAFGAIVLDDRFDYVFKPDVEASYVLKSVVFSEPGVFYPVTGGLISRPQYLYVPKMRAGPGQQ